MCILAKLRLQLYYSRLAAESRLAIACCLCSGLDLDAWVPSSLFHIEWLFSQLLKTKQK